VGGCTRIGSGNVLLLFNTQLVKLATFLAMMKGIFFRDCKKNGERKLILKA
jgi:hypothetical protein